MPLRAVERLIRERAGLNPAVLGGSVLALAVDRRAKACGVPARDYPGHLANDPAELSALLAELVVPETWFFRGGRALFDHLGGWLRDRAARRPVRVLSVPCSTGEEPYTLALAARQAGVPARRCAIDAADLDAAHLERAAAGVFHRFSFRPPDSADLYQTFRPTADGRYEVPPEVRALVRFVRGNLTDESFLAGEPGYDLIACRNLFIYLTPDAQKRAAANLDRLLAADGLLCLSATEADRLPAGRFAAEGPPELLLFRRAAVTPPSLLGKGGGGLGNARNLSPGPSPKKGGEQVGGRLPPAVGDARPHAPPSLLGKGAGGLGEAPTLADARALADAGQLDRALAACERLLAAGPTADAYSLLGLIHLARGAGDAATEAFRKALYLNPDHAEALSHMAVWHDHRGERAAADRLRRRLARAEREAPR